ncbi:MoaD/ThiS family protein [Algoriphagus limi]|uniref:MoaD/ThiS family protein n=1 Tax=Algoriphagus limi TaxID=2975273 RepID=A0ABT2G3X9_9BACT|nr:MoaD/ThiS family protein [Algoriphagus limi]MCS5489973.1 MoaD/ThiS family protein [Algoriphagus limi]
MDQKIRIRTFGMIAEEIGQSELVLDQLDSTERLKEFLYSQFPKLQSMKFSIAVNQQLAQGDEKIPEGAEVALLPPFSGG